MEQRSMKTTGFPDTDREMLQREFDKEFHSALEEARARRREGRQRAARQRDLQRRRVLMETMLQEEQEELSKDYQVGMMVELIKQNKIEASVRVDLNSISARSLAKALWTNRTITCLDLSSNSLSDHSGSYLARILKKNDTIVKLEIDNNQFGPNTCQAFGESLKINTSLVYLSLDSNPLTNGGKNINGFLNFAESLQSNTTLRSLNLWRTNIGPQAGAALAKAVRNNDTILFCDVGYCNIDMSDIKTIVNKKDNNLANFEHSERERRTELSLIDERKLKQLEVEEVGYYFLFNVLICG
jgi:Ran GTPase-activating protein (RanGAP) involved in mRNA processing and transport